MEKGNINSEAVHKRTERGEGLHAERTCRSDAGIFSDD